MLSNPKHSSRAKTGELNFNAGDEVVLVTRANEELYTLTETMLTPKRVKLSGCQFRRDNGDVVGYANEWYPPRIRKATDEDRAKFRRRALIRDIKAWSLESMPNELLEKLLLLVKEHEKARMAAFFQEQAVMQDAVRAVASAILPEEEKSQ